MVGSPACSSGGSRKDLAAATDLGLTRIKNIERGAADPRVSEINAIEKAFVDAGVRFFDDDEQGGIGVRLRRPARASARNTALNTG